MTETTKKAVSDFLSKDAILAAEDLKSVVVDVPEWGGCVTVRTMTGTDRDLFEASLNSMETGPDGEEKPRRNLENFRARLCACTMVNTKGNLLFPNPEDVVKLGKKSSRALDRVMTAAQKLNGIGAKDVEDLTKN
jgi:hypothetical protein